MNPEDLPEVLRIAKASLSEFWAPEDLEKAIRGWANAIGVSTIVDRTEDRICGFAQVSFASTIGEEIPSAEPFISDLLTIAVDPADRGKGVGSALLGEAMLVARDSPLGVSQIRLSVAESNVLGRKLFSAMGFREIYRSRLPQYVNGAHEIRMGRTVKPIFEDRPTPSRFLVRETPGTFEIPFDAGPFNTYGAPKKRTGRR